MDLYITGSTGEGFLMTDEERMRFAEVVVKQVAHRIPVVVHVGSIGTSKSIALARHAQKIGADAISSVPPFYYPFNADEIHGYYRDISEAVELPMIVYNIALAGLMNNNLVRRLATIDGVCGLQVHRYPASRHVCVEAGARRGFHGLYSGCDEMATQGLLAGADGIIGSFYNLLPDTFKEIYHLCQQKDYAAAFEIQKIATEFILKVVPLGHFGVMKQLLTDSWCRCGVCEKAIRASRCGSHGDGMVFYQRPSMSYGKSAYGVRWQPHIA